jgi:Predicted hydrolases or acyltransferases (alpha/beta hydrolase superfamily)
VKITANNIVVNYELSGKKDGPVVALSHSLGCNLTMWDPQVKILEPYYRVLRYDTRGHGGTDVPAGPYTLDQLGADALGLIDGLGFGVVNWVGLSLGGMIGQYIALSHPHRLQRLVLCDTTAIISMEAQPLFQERIHLARTQGMQALVQSTLERWFTPSFLSQKPLMGEQIRRQFLATASAGYVGCTESLKALNYLDRLSEIRTPTLIIVGKEDVGTPVAASQAMKERIPNSILVGYPLGFSSFQCRTT